VVPNLNETDRLNIAIEKQNQRFLAATNVELINQSQLPRKEAGAILDAIEAEDSRGALVIADAGFGKSCILAQVVAKLREDDVPFIAFKLDSIAECNTSKKIGSEIGLPESPASSLAKVAGNQRCVLIVDQLDAISLVSGRKTNTWVAFDELRRQAAEWPKMKLVIACRKFDLNQDHRLRPLSGATSEYKAVELTKLSDQDLRSALDHAGFRDFKPTPSQAEILNLPFHLTLFLQGRPEGSFGGVGELFNAYWNRKQQLLREALGRPGHWIDIIDSLTQYMSENQRLDAPLDVVDPWQHDADQMVSLHVLIDHGKSCQFFHESFFDYAFARRFCRSGQPLLSFLTQPGEEQHLFRRAQVRQILAYRRENRREEYYRDLTDLITNESVRFHIRRMVASELYRIDEPDEREWQIVEPLLWDHDLSRYIRAALRDHPGWFDLLFHCGVWSEWLASTDETRLSWALWFLEPHDLHRQRSEMIALLLEPFVNRGGEWDQHVKRILSWGIAHHSEQMTRIYFSMIERGVYDNDRRRDSGGDFWSAHYSAEKENPRFIIDMTACWLKHAIEKYDDGESWNILDKIPLNRSRSGAKLIENVAASEPEYFVSTILPVVVAAIARTAVQIDDEFRNRTWPWLTNHGDPSHIHEAILVSVRRALQWLATNSAEQFRTTIEPLKELPQQTVGFLVLSGFTENPDTFSDECVRYLLANKTRLNIGYGSWTGGGGTGESAVSRRAIQAVSATCDESLLRQLEGEIIEYSDAYERRTPRSRGFAEYLLLQAIHPARRSNRANVRIHELQCKFPSVDTQLPQPDESTMARFVGSPISQDRAELMTDDQWISAMQKYDRKRERWSGGGYVELSRLLADLTRKDRLRFAHLALEMPIDIDEE
ncbi:MAG: hypothetical protein KDA85_08090, partial [Planctomycetaceae bacterium]|nr:hypothetical protein [Planctomycetaceae bacterium]